VLIDFGGKSLGAMSLTEFSQDEKYAVGDDIEVALVGGEDGRIFAILRMDPSPTRLYGPMGPFRYALEARAGFFDSQGIRQGDAQLVVPEGR